MASLPFSLEALRAGDSAALTWLFEAYADRLYRLALGLLRDPAEAEDVVQETFLSAMTHLNRFEGRSSLGTWLYRVAYNAALDRLRRRTDEPLPADEPDSDLGDLPLPKALIEWRQTPEQLVADREVAAQLEHAIGELPQGLRSAFLLRDVEDLSTEEAAEVMGLTPGAVKVRLHRARLALRERLSGYFAERERRRGESV